MLRLMERASSMNLKHFYLNSLIFAVCLCPSSLFSQIPTAAPEAEQTIPTIDYCELRRNPDAYSEKIIRIKARYLSGFEMSALYGPACMDRRAFESWHETWVEIN